MPSITIKNIPDTLYQRLKDSAKAHRRSMNSEILVCIEQAVAHSQRDVGTILAKGRELRRMTANRPITEQMFDDAKREGRA